MRDDRRIPTSWLSVHRTVRGHIDKCLDILMETSEDDPVAQWLGPRGRERYLRLVLETGFRDGRVCLAQPRAGVCVATPTHTSGGLLAPAMSLHILWARLRFRMEVDAAKRKALQAGLRELTASLDPDSILVRYIGVDRRFRRRGLAPRLIRRALPDREAGPVHVLTGRPPFAQMLQAYEGTEITEVTLTDDGPSLFCCRIDVESLLRGNVRR